MSCSAINTGAPLVEQWSGGLAVAAMREEIYDPAAREVRVLAAALGPDGAVIGAAPQA